MKKTFTLLIGIILSVMILNAQEEAPPQAFSYKAIINDNGQPVFNKTVNLRISILQDSKDGITVYSETHQPTTNEFGQIDIEIGRGTPEISTEFDLGSDEYFLKTEVDIEGGTDYQVISITQLLSVPYALYAGKAKNGFVSEYTAGDPRPVIHEDGNISIGPTINPYWDSWFKLNVGGPVNITPGNKSWGADLILGGLPTNGNIYSISSVGSAAPCPGCFWIRTNDPDGKLNYNGAIVMKYNGNVGINTLNPSTKLDVNGSVNVRPGPNNWWGSTISLNATELEGGKTYMILSLGDQASEGQGNFLIRDEDWSATILMDPDGKVGIGLGQYGAPQFKLDVAGDINFSGGLFKEGKAFSGDYNNLTNRPDLSVYVTNAYVSKLESRITELENMLKSNGLIVKDADGNTYNTVKIGSQTWITENLKTTKYNNGDPIPNITVASEWSKLTIGAYCWYNNDAETYKNYGPLYNWFAVNDSRKLCPTGWHVPNINEWSTLIYYVGGTNVAGVKLKEAGTIHWQSPNNGATNEIGFTALPGGRAFDGFRYIGEIGFWWSSTSSGSKSARAIPLFSNNSTVDLNSNGSNQMGFSVRCVRDSY